jgi:hypothetical protein
MNRWPLSNLDPDAAMDFLGYVEERHRVWTARQVGAPQPWTDDPIIASRKFTNVFRLLDPGSQFVITDLFDEYLEAQDYLMRCFLYRHTNLPRAWRAFRAEAGRYPLIEDLPRVRAFWHDYRARGERVFSGAYMIYPQSSTPGTDKVDAILDLTTRLFVDGVVAHEFVSAGSWEGAFQSLRRNKGVADFMSMQILTDFGYGTDFHENDFVVPGPGARKGASYLGVSAETAIEWGFSVLAEVPNPPVIFGKHRPSRMDVQNCLCEFSKYARYQSKPSKQAPYTPANLGVQLAPKQPPFWNI